MKQTMEHMMMKKDISKTCSKLNWCLFLFRPVMHHTVAMRQPKPIGLHSLKDVETKSFLLHKKQQLHYCLEILFCSKLLFKL